MMKAFTFFVFMFAGTTIGVALMAGGGGLNTTQLNMGAGLTATGLTITVDDNTGFTSADTIWIDNEQIRYASKTGTTQLNVASTADRGINGSKAVAHDDNAVVRAEDSGVLNSVYGFDVGEIIDTWGAFSIIFIGANFFSHTIPYVLQGNMGNMFSGNGLSILVTLWLTLGAGFLFMLIMAFITARR